MNLINTILILIIIIFFINYFSNGQIITTLKRIFNSSINNLESFSGKQTLCYKSNQLDFPYVNNTDIENLDKETYNLYEYINYIVTKNSNMYKLEPSFTNRIKVDNNLQNNIKNILYNLFNNKGYNFDNIELNQDIYYYDNNRGKEFEPFIFTTNIYNNNKHVGNFTFLLDCFLIYNKNNNLLSINNLKIIKRNYPDKIKQSAVLKNKELNFKMNNTFNNLPITNNNDLFINQPTKKHVKFESNDTDNSLIPSIGDISL